jgi:hypothetical protein
MSIQALSYPMESEGYALSSIERFEVSDTRLKATQP